MVVCEERREILKRNLLQLRTEFQGKVRESQRKLRSSSGESPEHGDICDRGQVHCNYDIEAALLNQAQAGLKMIEFALANLDAGTYGFCSHCGEEISEKRLKAIPFALRCISCEK